MDHKLSILIFATLFSIQLSAQTTVTLNLNTGKAQDTYISDFPAFANKVLNPDPDLAGVAWTSGGTPYIGRGLFQFDLSVIPANATIIDAKLSLYGNPNPIHTGGHSNLSGSDSSYLQRIITSWNETTATWNNQPQTTSLNQFILKESTSAQEDYLDLNVTQLVTDMYNNPTAGYGFMIKLQTEQYYRSLNFASGNCTDTLKRPKLVITYTTQPCLTLSLTTGHAQDTYISDFPAFANKVLNPDPDLAGIAWTSGGTPYIGRGLFQFDFSVIPANATILSAKLDLYGNPNPIHTGGHSNLSGSDACYLQRIITSWNETTATWNNQPQSTTVNQVSLSQSTSAQEDYLNIDVTQLVSDIYNNPSAGYGFMIKLQNEAYYRSLNFASSNCTDSTKHPKLSVCYEISSSVKKIVGEKPELILYPNPASAQITLSILLNSASDLFVKIINMEGQVVYAENKSQFIGEYLTRIDLHERAKGIYFVNVITNKGSETKRFVVE